jgi:hypothetical protein
VPSGEEVELVPGALPVAQHDEHARPCLRCRVHAARLEPTHCEGDTKS